MNKEVKEIKQQIKRRQRYLNPDYLSLKIEEISILLDYINQLETNKDEAIEYIEKIYYSKNTIDINDIGYTTNKFLKIKQLLERGKE